jgi:hypothetical protein
LAGFGQLADFAQCNKGTTPVLTPVLLSPPCIEEQSRSGKSCTFESGAGGPHVTEARPAHSKERIPMTPVEWLLVELILAPIVGGLIAYGVVLWFGHGRALDHR